MSEKQTAVVRAGFGIYYDFFRSSLPFSVITQNFDPLNIGMTRRVDVIAGNPFGLTMQPRPAAGV